MSAVLESRELTGFCLLPVARLLLIFYHVVVIYTLECRSLRRKPFFQGLHTGKKSIPDKEILNTAELREIEKKALISLKFLYILRTAPDESVLP